MMREEGANKTDKTARMEPKNVLNKTIVNVLDLSDRFVTAAGVSKYTKVTKHNKYSYTIILCS